MYSLRLFFSKKSLVTLIFHIIILHPSITSALQVYAGAGQVSNDPNNPGSSCQDIQEFACNNDTCDQCAGPNNGGRCRNGGSSPDCQPGQLCNTPKAGHCLENTFCTSGRHTMPTAGTPKHFRCLSVTGLNHQGTIVIYQNNDYTGASCMINGDGVWASPNNELYNSVDTAPAGGQFNLCRKAGEATGGQQPLPVLGSVCNAHPELDTTDTCVSVAERFPDINNTFWYANAQEEEFGKRLRRRGENFRLSSSGKVHFSSWGACECRD